MPRLDRATALGFVAVLALLGCARQDQTNVEGAGAAAEDTATVMAAVAEVAPVGGSQVRGTITFTQEAEGVRMIADLSGLTPGDHGMHVHQGGDCANPGDHFNPTGAPHGDPQAAQHHLGDLGNVTADAGGNARLDRVFPALTLQGDQTILGRALVVHSGTDDLTSQPSGSSGDPVACGVIHTR